MIIHFVWTGVTTPSIWLVVTDKKKGISSTIWVVMSIEKVKVVFGFEPHWTIELSPTVFTLIVRIQGCYSCYIVWTIVAWFRAINASLFWNFVNREFQTLLLNSLSAPNPVINQVAWPSFPPQYSVDRFSIFTTAKSEKNHRVLFTGPQWPEIQLGTSVVEPPWF